MYTNTIKIYFDGIALLYSELNQLDFFMMSKS